MNGWVKHFSDGISELGTDSLVKSNKVSWQHGRLDGLVAVDLHWKNNLYSLSAGPGEYWQSDTMISVRTLGKMLPPKMLTRRISRKIDLSDVGKIIQHYQSGKVIRVVITDKEDKVNNSKVIDITEAMVNKWLTLEVNGDSGKLKINLSATRK